MFVGRDHAELPAYKLLTDPDPLHLTGSYTGILPSRLSYIYNLLGPSYVVDTACSSGLVAVHLACESIRSQSCDMAIAGGINLLMLPLKDHGLK